MTPADDHAPSTVLPGGLEDAISRHEVTSTHPPTLVDAAANLWLSRDDVRHGIAGQLAALFSGLVQFAGLAACWATAHVFFSTKTRAALFALALVVGFTAYAVATHA
jgi:hypothetical protein